MRLPPLVLAALLGSQSATAAIRFLTEPSIVANPNREVPLAAVIRFTVSELADTFISISDGVHTSELRYDSGRDPAGGLPVVGLRPGKTHRIQVTIRDKAFGEIHIGTDRDKDLSSLVEKLLTEATSPKP